jgi:C-terminal processing protease CtpA/Prc
MRTHVWLLTSLTLTLSAAEGPLDRVSRLAVVADLWSKVYLYHPRIAAGQVDFNEVLLKAIPKIEQAPSDAEFVRIINEHVLGPLGDNQTTAQLAIPASCGPSASGPPPAIQTRRLSPKVGLVKIPDPRVEADRVNPFLDPFQSAVNSFGHIEQLIVDLRYEVDAEVDDWTTYWLGLFVDKPLEQAHYLQREHGGLNEYNSANNAYRQRWRIDGGDALPRAFWNSVIRPQIVVPTLFVVNNASYPRYARRLDSLQGAGLANVLWENSGCSVGPDVEQFAGRIRMYLNGKQLLNGSPTGAHPDRTADKRLSDEQLLSAATELLPRLRAREATSVTIPPLRFRPYETSAEALSAREQRIFWLIKVWMAVRHFFPHHEFASVKWADALQMWIPRVEAARNSDEFFDILRQMTAPLNDSHIRVVAPNGHPSRSVFYPHVRIARVQGKVVVTAAGGDAQGDVKAGDEVVAIDGRSVTQIEEHMRLRISASTEGAFQRAWNSQTYGSRDSKAQLTLRRNGTSYTVSLPRTRTQPLPERTYAASRQLEGSMGYLNLFMFKTEDELRSAFLALRSSAGLILDLRGYPSYGDARVFLAKRLYDHTVRSALDQYPLLTRHRPREISGVARFEYHQPVIAEYYGSPVIVLINASAQSYPESIALDLTNEHRVTFVGSPSTGTTGGATVLQLPGGWWLEFTGTKVMYPDGRRFQNIGIIPDVHVEPTIRGLQAGTDEVFEKGVDVLRSMIRTRQ